MINNINEKIKRHFEKHNGLVIDDTIYIMDRRTGKTVEYKEDQEIRVTTKQHGVINYKILTFVKNEIWLDYVEKKPHQNRKFIVSPDWFVVDCRKIAKVI